MTAASWVYDGAAADVTAAAERIGSPAGDALAAGAGGLVRDAERLGAALSQAIEEVSSPERLADLVSNPLGDRPPIPETTANRLLEAGARRALATGIAALSAVELARRVALAPYPHRSAAATARDRAFDALDAVAPGASDEAIAAMRALKAAATGALRQRIASLPGVVHATPGAVLPSLVIAYDLYGDLGRSTEIATRNAASRPGFLPARPLEVLSR